MAEHVVRIVMQRHSYHQFAILHVETSPAPTLSVDTAAMQVIDNIAFTPEEIAKFMQTFTSTLEENAVRAHIVVSTLKVHPVDTHELSFKLAAHQLADLLKQE